MYCFAALKEILSYTNGYEFLFFIMVNTKYSTKSWVSGFIYYKEPC